LPAVPLLHLWRFFTPAPDCTPRLPFCEFLPAAVKCHFFQSFALKSQQETYNARSLLGKMADAADCSLLSPAALSKVSKLTRA
jgi:hypothetical protein